MAYIEIQLSDNENWSDPETIAPIVRVEMPCNDMNIGQVWATLIKPALLGCGFFEDTIDGLFEEKQS